jgi:hypothetical protein
LFGIDPRTLAVFRIALGCVVLVDLLIRASDLGAMYTDAGMFSRADILRRYTGDWVWSFHFGSGSWGYQAGLFTLAGLLGLGLVLGFETRWMTIGSWLLAVSVQNRVPPILNGGDGLMRMLLFWSMFLPLGRCWSVDAWRVGRAGGGEATARDRVPGKVVSAGSAAILVQMALMYFFSAAFKTNVTWLKGGVIAGTLAHDFYAKPLGTLLLGYPALMKGMTLGVFVLEWAGPVLLFFPWGTARVRLVIVALLAAMHLGIQFTLNVGMFSWVSLAGLTLFLPGALWDRWAGVGSVGLGAGAGASGLCLGRGAVAGAGWVAAMPRLANGLCLVLLAYVLWVNITSLPGHPLSPRPVTGSSFLRTACGLGQKWNMFDEVPSKDGWYVAWAKLRDGTEVDLLRGGAAVSWDRPADPAGAYPNHRWRKCFREMAYFDQMGYQVFRVPVGRYLCGRWEAGQGSDKQVQEFDFVYCMESGRASDAGESVRVTIRERLIQLKPGRAESEAWAARGL